MKSRFVMIGLLLILTIMFVPAYADTGTVCPGFLPSRLVIGEVARVLPDTANRLRESASTQSVILIEIPVGATASVLDGPQCDSAGMAWWQVDYQGITGWTAEGQADQYWLEPVQRITAENAAQVTQIARLGRGSINTKVLWLPDGTIAAGGQFGVWLFDGNDLSTQPQLLETSDLVHYLTVTSDDKTLISVECGERDQYDICVKDTARYWELETRTQIRSIELDTFLGITAINGDGSLAASAVRQDIEIWNLQNGERQDVLYGHLQKISVLTYSRDGVLASGTFFGEIRLWDSARHKTLVMISGENMITDLEFSPDGMIFASASTNETLSIWDIETGLVLYTLDNNADVENPNCAYGCLESDGKTTAADLIFSPDGKQLASANWAGTLTLWEVSSHRQLQVVNTHIFTPMTSVAFSPDSKRLATNAVDNGFPDNRVMVWDIALERLVADWKEGHYGSVEDVEFSPDGQIIASTANGSENVLLWDVSSGVQKSVLSSNWGRNNDLAFSPDGKLLAGAGTDFCGECGRPGLRIWDMNTLKIIAELQGDIGEETSSIAFSPDGSTFAASLHEGDNISIKLWNAQDLIRTQSLTSNDEITQLSFGDQNLDMEKTAFSPDGSLLAVGDASGVIHIWNVQTGAEVYLLENKGSPVWDMAFSPDGKRIASANGTESYQDSKIVPDYTVRLWDVESRQEITVLQHNTVVTSFAFSPDGTLIASGTIDGTIRFWGTTTYTQISEIPTGCGRISNVKFSPDGTLLASGCGDNTIRLWGVMR